MFTAILIETKLILKSKKTKLLFLVNLLLIVGMIASENYLNKFNKTRNDYMEEQVRSLEFLNSLENFEQTRSTESAKKEVMNYLVIVKKIIAAYEENDMYKLNEAFLIENYYYVKNAIRNYSRDSQSEENFLKSHYFMDSKKLAKLQEVIDKYNSHPITMNYRDFEFYHNSIEKYVHFLPNFNLYRYNYENSLPFMDFHEINPSSIISFYFQYYPLILITLTVILSFDHFSNDREDGTIKLYLNIPYNKIKITTIKLVALANACFIIFILPLLTLSFIYACFRGFNTYIYPLNIYTKGLYSLKPNLKFINYEMNYLQYTKIEMSPFSSFLGYTEHQNEPIFSMTRLEIIPMYLFNIYCFLTSFFSIILTLNLNRLLSILIKNKLLVLINHLIIICIGFMLTKIAFGSIINHFNPYQFIESIPILNSTVPYTYLNGIIVFIVLNIIIHLFVKFIISKKEFI